ncbi:MAG: hypothetical protein Q8P13_03630 [bacterium]|nr:hypothetical protein [bacterium]
MEEQTPSLSPSSDTDQAVLATEKKSDENQGKTGLLVAILAVLLILFGLGFIFFRSSGGEENRQANSTQSSTPRQATSSSPTEH